MIHLLRAPIDKLSRQRQSLGQSLIEVVSGGIILVILLLTFLDVFAVVLGKMTNDSLLMKAARAASRQQTWDEAITAVKAVQSTASNVTIKVTAFTNPDGGKAPPKNQRTLSGYNTITTNSGYCSVEAKLTVNLPAPVPFSGMSQIILTNETQVPLTGWAAQ